MLYVTDCLSVPERELTYRSSRSSGPGGQNVNKVETRVTVLFDVGHSAVLDDDQKARVRERLATRINKDGVLRVVSQKHRTQAANRDAARAKLAELLLRALAVRRKRKRTRPSREAKRRRLEDKRRRGELKRRRSRVTDS
ncbi:MAG: alternative ribosome rescue aminoacyl-tRNA hydrolase ArfB [Thermoanaerobaculia bacterium]